MPLLLCAPRDAAKLAPCCAPSANDVTLSPCFDASQDDVEDNEESTRAFQQRALAGDADGLYQLGQAYRQGNGAEKNLFVAARLFEQSAELRHVGGLCELGLCSLNGIAIPAGQSERNPSASRSSCAWELEGYEFAGRELRRRFQR